MSSARSLATTIRKYIRGATEEVIRNRKMLAKLQADGRLTFNNSGLDVQWQVEYKESPMQGFDDGDTLTFAVVNRWKNAVLPYRGYANTDQITKKQELENRGEQALVKLVEGIAKRLMNDCERQASTELYVDGNASGNTKRWHGLESFFGNSGAASGGYIGTPSDTYAGLSTVLANYGGTWTGNWPTGTGDAHYDFWSPLVVDYTDTAWQATTKTFANTCLEALSYGIIKGKKNMSKNGQLDMVMLNDELFRSFREKLKLEEQINVVKGDGSSGMLKLGFDDIINYDGVDVMTEYGIPDAVGYGIPTGVMELMSMQESLFDSSGPEFDLASQCHRFAVLNFGNLKCEGVRNFVKFMSIT